MWPKLLDMEPDECRQVLRRLELEAYSNVISAFRAQGYLTLEKKSLLNTIATTLGISTERHKAEVRRAVNDEKLTTIAERIGGENSAAEWSTEGRRLIPMMPRMIPQTAFTVTANQVANMAYAHNATLPDPKDTANTAGSGSKKESGRGQMKSEDLPTHIVLPPGTVLPKSIPDLQKLEEQHKPRHLLSSSASYAPNPASFLNALTSSKHSTSSSTSMSKVAGPKFTGAKGAGQKFGGRSASTSGIGASPSSMKITYSKSHPPSSLGQKVMMMPGANPAEQTMQTHVMYQSQGLPSSTKVTMATMSEMSRHGAMGHRERLEDPPVSTTHYQPAPKHHRSKSGSKHKSAKHQPMVQHPAVMQHTPGLGVGTAPGIVYSTAVNTGGGVVPTVIGTAGKRTGTMQAQRPEPGMKLITQTVASSAGRLTSKTYQVSASAPSPAARTTMVGMQAPKGAMSPAIHSGPLSPVGGARNLVSPPGPRIMTLPSTMAPRGPPSTSNVITLSSMAMQKGGGKNPTTTVVVSKPGAMVPGKTNVIVVQKSQIKSKMMMNPASPGVMSHTTSILTRPKIAMTMTGVGGVGGMGVGTGVAPLPPTSPSPGPISPQTVRFPSPPYPSSLHHKTVRGPAPVVMGPGGGGVMGGASSLRGRSPGMMGAGPITGPRPHGMVRPKSPIAQTMATLSADLELQSKVKGHKRSSSSSVSALPGQGAPKVVVEEVPGGVMRRAGLGRDPSLVFPPGSKPNSEWIEYDGSPPPPGQSASSAIKALLEFRGHPSQPLSGVKPGSSSESPSSTSITRALLSDPTIPAMTSMPSDQAREPSRNVVTVEVRGGQAQRLEFTADQISSVMDQYEQFLESEENLDDGSKRRGPSSLEKEKPTSSSASSTSSMSAPPPTSSTSAPSSMVSSSSLGSKSMEQKAESSSRIDPFEFVEEIISKEREALATLKSEREALASLKSASTTRPDVAKETSVPAIIDRSVSAQKQPTAGVATTTVTASATSTVAPTPVVTVATVPATSVVMETTATFDITQMNLEDLSCRRMREEEEEDGDDDDDDDVEEEEDGEKRGQEEPGSATESMLFDTSSGGSGSEGMAGSDSSLRISRRKRKAPTPIDEETGPSSMPSWARAAWNLLQRVMRFRGANRPKGGINAASWFTRPVHPKEAPNYYKVIKKPMDFGTIKRNLEAATYQDFGEFHTDMMLVKNNCLKYNPPDHAARRDCEEVFHFYTSEYSKTVDRWQKQLIVTPKSPKRLKLDQPTPPPAPPQT